MKAFNSDFDIDSVFGCELEWSITSTTPSSSSSLTSSSDKPSHSSSPSSSSFESLPSSPSTSASSLWPSSSSATARRFAAGSSSSGANCDSKCLRKISSADSGSSDATVLRDAALRLPRTAIVWGSVGVLGRGAVGADGGVGDWEIFGQPRGDLARLPHHSLVYLSENPRHLSAISVHKDPTDGL